MALSTSSSDLASGGQPLDRPLVRTDPGGSLRGARVPRLTPGTNSPRRAPLWLLCRCCSSGPELDKGRCCASFGARHPGRRCHPTDRLGISPQRQGAGGRRPQAAGATPHDLGRPEMSVPFDATNYKPPTRTADLLERPGWPPISCLQVWRSSSWRLASEDLRFPCRVAGPLPSKPLR